MKIGDVDVSECKYLNIKNLTLNWGIGKEYTKEYKCKECLNEDDDCGCDYLRIKRRIEEVLGNENVFD